MGQIRFQDSRAALPPKWSHPKAAAWAPVALALAVGEGHWAPWEPQPGCMWPRSPRGGSCAERPEHRLPGSARDPGPRGRRREASCGTEGAPRWQGRSVLLLMAGWMLSPMTNPWAAQRRQEGRHYSCRGRVLTRAPPWSALNVPRMLLIPAFVSVKNEKKDVVSVPELPGPVAACSPQGPGARVWVAAWHLCALAARHASSRQWPVAGSPGPGLSLLHSAFQ